MGKGYILVEGHGETEAAGNLIHRLWTDLGLQPFHWAQPLRWKNLHQERGIDKGCGYIRAKGDADALLILRDEDDDCPREFGPKHSEWVKKLNLSFPVATVLLYREYEVLFLPCIHLMAGKTLGKLPGQPRPGICEGTLFDGNPESIRGVKEWLSRQFPKNRRYKPTSDQLSLTRMIDFPTLREAKVPCFETLERALRFLEQGQAGDVYPPPHN